MTDRSLSIEYFWKRDEFQPNDEQRAAILHADGPLYLTAGPGSGKTLVLLWRALNLLVFHDVRPEEVFLSTFTEKAARQLREGLQALLGMATNVNGQPYDITQMYVGTVHSLCQRMLRERRFTPDRQRSRPPRLLDELGQYFHLYRTRNWTELTTGVGIEEDAELCINKAYSRHDSRSKHYAVIGCMAFFNRLSEECIDPERALQTLASADPGLLAYLAAQEIEPEGLELLFRLYAQYRRTLVTRTNVSLTDFSLLQQAAFGYLSASTAMDGSFKYVIVDEYQDTNTIQERLFFKLAALYGNICVVGDDDQALYRFRGATVENFVQFPERCFRYLGQYPRRIHLSTNYRSRESVLDFYTDFMDHCDWCKEPGGSDGLYRVANKNLRASRVDPHPAVVATTRAIPEEACAEIAGLVRVLIDQGKVENANQIAFLFPSLKSTRVPVMKQALEDQGLQVYAPRAGRFLEVDEAIDMFGLLAQVLGLPPRGHIRGRDYAEFCTWLDQIDERGAELTAQDQHLAGFVDDQRAELAMVATDYQALLDVVQRNHWDLSAPYDLGSMKRPLYNAGGLSQQARRALASGHFERVAQRRAREGRPFSLKYIVTRATSLDWNILDLFYRFCGFKHFRAMLDLAESGEDEGPICNLSLISQYLARFTDEYVTIIRADLLVEPILQRLFFRSYLYVLFRLGESEYENSEDPFPKGNIPFLTIHQAKGLEFPVVVLGVPYKRDRGPQRVERLVHPFLSREDEGEPLERMAEFDIMRMFYVALSRAKNLLVITHCRGRGQFTGSPFKAMLDDDFPRIPDLDLDTIPSAHLDEERLPKPYSFTGDYLAYRRCARQYMIFRKYGFEASQTRTMLFGSLVHRTLDDLHNYLIARKAQQS